MYSFLIKCPNFNIVVYGNLMVESHHFFCVDFLRFIALNAIWAHCLGLKLHFRPILFPLNTLNKTKLTRSGKKKSLLSDVRVEE